MDESVFEIAEPGFSKLRATLDALVASLRALKL